MTEKKNAMQHFDSKQKILFTPGPLTTTLSVKLAMLKDIGSRDEELAHMVKDINQQVLELGQCDPKNFACILMQGSGTFGVESVLSSVVGTNDKILILENGAYGRRLEAIARAHKLPFSVCRFAENQVVDHKVVRDYLIKERFTHMAMIHCETTTGVLNPLSHIGGLAKEFNISFVVDAMSTFGGIPVDIPENNIDFLISSSNKCIEGVPGFSFIVANIEKLKNSEGKARTLSLDLLAQYKGFLAEGQFRFTPPTHVIAAFHKALTLLKAEGGVAARFRRYQNNHSVLVDKMTKMGFLCYIESALQSCIITSFRYPNDVHFDFHDFYQRLKDRGYLIYPGKVSDADCFRVGTIGHVFPHDVENLTAAIAQVLKEMKISLFCS